MTFEAILSHFQDVKASGRGWIARCPAHDDKNPSLTLYPATNSKSENYMAIKCQSGCTWEAILDKAGLKKSDIYLVSKKPSSPTAEQKSTAIDKDKPTSAYSYTDEHGKELYQNCRYETDKNGVKLAKKTFLQRRKHGDQWVYSLGDTRHVPYNFPALLAEPFTVWECEGEKDANSLIAWGLSATSTVKCEAEYSKYCQGKVVVVCEDNDEPGRKKAKEKAEAYWKAGALTVKILRFPDLPEKSDVTDWIQSNPSENDIFALQAIVQHLPEFSPLNKYLVSLKHKKRSIVPIIEIDGRNVLPLGCIGGLTAGIGQGKSHFLQIMAAEALTPGVEPESRVKINLSNGDKIAMIDTEQPEDDCNEILKRIERRCQLTDDDYRLDGVTFKRLEVYSLIGADIPERIEMLKNLMTRPDIKLIFLDGLLDFMANPNDPETGTNFIIWLFSAAAKYEKAIFCTIHGNRGDITGKGKGWTGDVFQRKATCFLLLRKHKIDPKIRVVTLDFDNAKMRHGDDTGLTLAMSWNPEIGGFSCISAPSEDGKPSKDYYFEQVFLNAGNAMLRKPELNDQYQKVAGVSRQAANSAINAAVKSGILDIQDVGGFKFYVLL